MVVVGVVVVDGVVVVVVVVIALFESSAGSPYICINKNYVMFLPVEKLSAFIEEPILKMCNCLANIVVAVGATGV